MLDNPAAFTGTFGGPAEFTSGDVTLTCWAEVQEGAVLGRPGAGFDQEFGAGLAHYATGWVVCAELQSGGISRPAFMDTLTKDGETWRVEQARREGSLWLLMLSNDQRGGR